MPAFPSGLDNISLKMIMHVIVILKSGPWILDASRVGIYPSGGSLNERWETVGLWLWIEIGQMGMAGLRS